MASRGRVRFWMSVHAAAAAVERWAFRRHEDVSGVRRLVLLPDEVPVPRGKRITVSLPPAHELTGRPMPIPAIIFDRCPICAGDFVELVPPEGPRPARNGCPNCGWPLKRAHEDIEKFGTVPRAWRLPERRRL